MECYVYADNWGKKNAVAVCVLCGTGLCRDHAVREELPLWIESGSRPTIEESKLSEQLRENAFAYCLPLLS